LIGEAACVEFIPLPFSRQRHKRVTTHRFDETIGGRVYQIEVTPVSNRWRAQLRRTPGLPAAMMPFYGKTPDEAARQLARWLTLAHGRQEGAHAAPDRVEV
jgi:hypothetical protein